MPSKTFQSFFLFIRLLLQYFLYKNINIRYNGVKY